MNNCISNFQPVPCLAADLPVSEVQNMVKHLPLLRKLRLDYNVDFPTDTHSLCNVLLPLKHLISVNWGWYVVEFCYLPFLIHAKSGLRSPRMKLAL
jgi:hypothetical protein